MKKMMRGIVLGGFATAALAVTSQPASASMLLRLSEGGNFAQCDQSLGTCAPTGLTTGGTVVGGFSSVTGNTLNFSGTIGDFTIALVATDSNIPGGDTSYMDITGLTVRNTSGSAQTLVIDLTGFGFLLPGGPAMTLTGSGSESTPSVTTGATITSSAYADPNNTGLMLNQTQCQMVLTTATSCSDVPVAWTRLAGPYSLRDVLTLTVGAGQQFNATSNLAASAVPEPASLVLLGSGLVAAASRLRKKNRKA